MSAPGRKRGFAAALLRWYDAGNRDLPWRRAPSPYRSLVSELMLQQTVVATVIPYFERFVARFPDFEALASAPEGDVLAHWSGLGYYARARNLQRAAQAVVSTHGGRLPETEEALRALPGIGPYTAAALAAICFGVRTFALDGNAARVVARLFADEAPIDEPAGRTRLRALGQTLVPEERAGDFAQAVMELGARICAPRTPRCESCPVARHCDARAVGIERRLPVRKPRRPKRLVSLACVAVERQGRLLLVRRPAGVLLGGTWVLPLAERAVAEGDHEVCGRALAQVGVRTRGAPRLAGSVRHVFTHRDVTADVYACEAAEARGRAAEGSSRALETGGEPADEARWVTRAELDGLALSSFTRKTLGLVFDAGGRLFDPSPA